MHGGLAPRMVNAGIDATMGGPDITAIGPAQPRRTCAETESPGDRSGEASMTTTTCRRQILGMRRARAETLNQIGFDLGREVLIWAGYQVGNGELGDDASQLLALIITQVQ